MDILWLIGATLITCLLFVLSFLLHELGHASVVALLLGRSSVHEIRAGSLTFLRWKKLAVGILPVWGYVRFDEKKASPQDWRLIFVAGPFASLLTGYWFLALHWLAPQVGIPHNWQQVFLLMAMANFALAGFNLIPIPPLDGWKILESWLPLMGIHLTDESRRTLYRWGILVITVLSFGFVAIHGFYHAH